VAFGLNLEFKRLFPNFKRRILSSAYHGRFAEYRLTKIILIVVTSFSNILQKDYGDTRGNILTKLNYYH